MTGPPLLVGVKKPQTKQKGENKNNRKNRPEHPCRLASRKRASEGASSLKPPKYRENPTKTPKRTGPRKAPRQNARKKGRTARTGNNKCGGDKNKGNRPKRCVRGVPCDYLSCISQKTETTTTENQERENEPKNGRPDIKRIFPNSFGSKMPKPETKTLGKTPSKNTRPTSTPKNKSSLPKIYSQQRPQEEKNSKKIKQRTPNLPLRNKKRKMDSISPFEKGEKTATQV